MRKKRGDWIMNKGFLIDLGVSTLNFVAENLKPTFTTHSQHSGR